MKSVKLNQRALPLRSEITQSRLSEAVPDSRAAGTLIALSKSGSLRRLMVLSLRAIMPNAPGDLRERLALLSSTHRSGPHPRAVDGGRHLSRS